MNNCNGNGECDLSNGICKCSSLDYKGADCSYHSTDLSRDPHKIAVTHGDQFIYFTVPNLPAAWSVSLKSSSRDFTVYIKSGLDSTPNQFNYDSAFKKWSHANKLTFTSDQFTDGNLSGAIWVHGFEELINTSFSNHI